MRVFFAVVVAVAGASLSPVRFPLQSGWYSGTAAAHACPGVAAARCSEAWSWAATVRWKDCSDCLPHRTIASLPSSGLAIQVSLIRERPVTAKSALIWPPHVAAADVGGLEGLSNRIGVYQRFARVGEFEVQIFVFFGRSRPTASQLVAANKELHATRLP